MTIPELREGMKIELSLKELSTPIVRTLHINTEFFASLKGCFFIWEQNPNHGVKLYLFKPNDDKFNFTRIIKYNIKFLDSPVIEKKKDACACPIYELFNFGCKCGSFQKEKKC